MDHEIDSTFRNMYFGAEVRFDGLARLIRAAANRIGVRPARSVEVPAVTAAA